MKAMRSVLPAVAGMVIGACDEPTGICNSCSLDPPLAGTWFYTMTTERIDSTPQLGDAQCQVFEATMELSQEGMQFDGTIDGVVNCAVIGETSEVVFSDRVTNGLLDGDAVSFNIGTWESTGTLSGGSMAGDATMDLLVDGIQPFLSGEWSASRGRQFAAFR